jgi:hypothetical protein
MTLRAVCACAALVLACNVSAAPAREFWHKGHGAEWRETHEAIYALENRIALLEADPEMDDGYKAPVITRARAEIRRLRATLYPAQWQWVSPCCYSRRPIYIR